MNEPSKDYKFKKITLYELLIMFLIGIKKHWKMG